MRRLSSAELESCTLPRNSGATCHLTCVHHNVLQLPPHHSCPFHHSGPVGPLLCIAVHVS